MRSVWRTFQHTYILENAWISKQHGYAQLRLLFHSRHNTIQCDTRCYFKVRSKADKQLIYRMRPKLESGKKAIQQTTISQACLLLNIEAGCRGGGYDVGVAIHVVRVMDGRSLAVQLVLWVNRSMFGHHDPINAVLHEHVTGYLSPGHSPVPPKTSIGLEFRIIEFGFKSRVN